ncbi:MAG: DUF2092 domain-containing protein [Rhizobiales bacterium]|nr:DUF2092 domain-containing protein [Hyphomicrobiales bacterium]
MNSQATCRLPDLVGTQAWTCAFTIASILFGVATAHSQEDSARKILKGMASYLAGQKTISATFDADIEVITPTLQKIQFTNSGGLTMNRPSQFRATRAGGYSDVELVFDGTTATILGRHNNTYAQIKAPGSIDQLIDRLRDEHGVTMPGADLLLARVYDELIGDATEIRHIGHGVIDGKDCDHLAFRGPEVDWQLWVEIGPNPIPRKYVITSKAVTGAPQYTLRIKTWTTGAPASPDAFAFNVPAGAKMVEIKQLADIDEVPAGVVAGDAK